MKRYHLILAATLIFMGGTYGLKETVTHHYGAFAERFPAANNTIFYSTTDSKLSYKNPAGVVHGLY